MVYEGDDIGPESRQEAGGLGGVDTKALPLSKRIALQKEATDHISVVKGQFGAKEISYVPKSSRKREVEQPAKSGRRRRKHIG